MKNKGLAKSALTIALLGIATDPGGVHLANAVKIKSTLEQKSSAEVKSTTKIK